MVTDNVDIPFCGIDWTTSAQWKNSPKQPSPQEDPDYKWPEQEFLNSKLKGPKWDLRFLHLAEHISAWSKDPSTKCGAVIVDSHNKIISLGFNGLPRGVPDLEEYLLDRELKLQMILHAEVNAILFARQDLKGCTIYTWPFLSCCRCATVIIQSGLTRVVTPLLENELTKRWYKEIGIARELYKEAGVVVEEIRL